MDLSDSLSKSPYSYPKFRNLCDQDPLHYFLPLSGSHRLKCNFNVTLERKGRDDVSCSYQWESSKIDWWLAVNLDQIQLNEVAFRLKLLTWRHRSPFMRSSERMIPEFSYHWVRPGSEAEEEGSEENKLKSGSSTSHPFLAFFQYLNSKRSALSLVFLSVLVLVLVYVFSQGTNIK